MVILESEKYEPRAYTNKVLLGLDFGEIDARELSENLLRWFSEDEVKEFAEYYEYVTLEGGEDEDEDIDF